MQFSLHFSVKHVSYIQFVHDLNGTLHRAFNFLLDALEKKHSMTGSSCGAHLS